MSAPTELKGIVKQVLSGDTVVLFTSSPGSKLPNDETVSFAGLSAPKLAKRPGPNESNEPSKHEKFAWEAREFLRRLVVGRGEVTFVVERTVSSRNYGTLLLGKDKRNVNELMIQEGWVSVRDNAPKRLLELQEAAKANGKGIHADEQTCNIKEKTVVWTVKDTKQFLDQYGGKPLPAVIEVVTVGSTVRVTLLLPELTSVIVMMRGIKCQSGQGGDSPDLFKDAKHYVELRLLHREVTVTLDEVAYGGSNFIGTVMHPAGSIAELLLKEGLAKFWDSGVGKMSKTEQDRYRQLEKEAKDRRLNIWKNYKPPDPISNREFTGTVIEIINGDAMNVRLEDGTVKKIFLSHVRPPREAPSEDGQPKPRTKRSLYDIPWMFEAREFLRKKLVGKKVKVFVDFEQEVKENIKNPIKLNCTVYINNVNVAETLVSRGYATVIKYKADSSTEKSKEYPSLLAAEKAAEKGLKGLHAKKDIPTHRVNDCSQDLAKAKAYLPHLTRPDRLEAIVEYVFSASRLRLFIPKESCLIVFLLSGIEARRSDPASNDTASLQFTRDKCMQREVEIKVESIDRVGNFVGWLFVDKVNLSVALVEEGLANIYSTGENSIYAKELNNAKNIAKSKGVWKYVDKEETKEIPDDTRFKDRRIDYQEVKVVLTKEISFYCHYVNKMNELKTLDSKLALEMTANPPLPGAYTPKKGDLCVAKFKDDGAWYRAKVDKVSGSNVTVTFIDYGNKSEVPATECAILPPAFTKEKAYAQNFSLAFVRLPTDPDYHPMAELKFWEEVDKHPSLLLNQEYSDNGITYVTLVDPEKKEDVAKNIIAEGLLLVNKQRGKRFEEILNSYSETEAEARRKRLNIWEYGDVREDDDKEFGMGR